MTEPEGTMLEFEVVFPISMIEPVFAE